MAKKKQARIVNAGNLEMVSVEKLKLHPKNPRQGDIGVIHQSIESNGFYGALVVQKSTGYVLAGNHRLQAAKEAGMDKVPVLYVKVDDDRALRILLADNRTNDLASYDSAALAELLKDIQRETDTLEGTGYDGDALDELLAEVNGKAEVVEDEAPAVAKKAVSKRGEIYALGKHRLLCGDSTKAEDVARLMGNEKADMVFTDPPYGVGFSYATYNDDISKEKHAEFSRKWWAVVKGRSDFIVVTAGFSNEAIFFSIEPSFNLLVWHKKFSISTSTVSFARVTEPIFVYGKPPIKRYDTDFFEFGTDREAGLHKDHPCPKPVALIAALIEPQTKQDGTVLDVFGGSGTTLIACEQLKRRCRMLEIDPLYVDVIRKRWWKFTHDCNEEGWQVGTAPAKEAKHRAA